MAESARSNLAHAHSTDPDVLLEDLCFDLQQAAEKAMKGVFVLRGEIFPYIHDLKKLLQGLERNGQKIPKYLWQADKLSPPARGTRYPEVVGAVTPAQYRRAVRIAKTVLSWPSG
jgi:HEPN domain-containing protein